MPTEIDNLQIKITASATTATNALNALVKSLQKVRSSLTGMKDGIPVSERLTTSFREVNYALSQISGRGVARLQELTAALNGYASAIKGIKGVKGVSLPQGVDISNTNGLKEVADEMEVVAEAADDVTQSMDETSDSIGQSGKKAKEAVPRLQRIKDAFSKIDSALKKVQITTKTSTGAFGKFIRSIGRIALYRIIRSAIKDIGEAFSDGLKNAYLFSKQHSNFTRLAEALDHLKSITTQMKNQLGALVGELKQLIMPLVNWIVEKIRWIAEQLTQLFAALNGQDTYQFAKLQAENWEEATKKAKEYKQQLLGIDELNNLSDKDKATDEAKKAQDAFEVKPVGENFKNIAIKWNSTFKKIKKIFTEFSEMFEFLGVGAVAIGTILLFVPGMRGKGLGLILAGTGVLALTEGLKFGWGELLKKITKVFKKYKGLFNAIGTAAVAVGVMLLFVPGYRGLGLGLILGGTALKTLAEVQEFSWDGLKETIVKKFKEWKELFKKAAPVVTALGVILLFVPGQRLLGIGLILASNLLKGLADQEDWSWNGLKNTILKKFEKYKEMFNQVAAPACVALGVILLFIPGQRGLGIGLLLAAGVLKASEYNFDWNYILDNLQKAWDKIRLWWYNNVKGKVAEAANWIEETLGWDVNGDGKIGGLQTKFDMSDIEGKKTQVTKNSPNLDLLKINNPSGLIKDFAETLSKGNIQTEIMIGEPTNDTLKDFKKRLKNGAKFDTVVEGGKEPVPAFSAYDTLKKWQEETGNITLQGAAGDKAREYTANAFKTGMAGHMVDVVGEWFGQEPGWFNPNRKRELKALGGIPSNGSLFYAGESGAEFVGNIGSTSAVANTGQMTDAIYKAAYMGMSKALKENGNGNMSGWEASTTDEIFAVMRKKASNYNKRTGNPAFA